MPKALKKALLVLFLAALLTCLAVAGLQRYQESYVNFGGYTYPRDARQVDHSGRSLGNIQKLSRFTELELLDLRGSRITPEEYDEVCRVLPDCLVLWDVPFQDGYHNQNTQQLTIMALSEEDIAALDYFPQLRSVVAWDCPDTAALAKLQQRRPECKVLYNVTIGGQVYDCETSTLTLVDAGKDLDEQVMGYLPRLRSVHFTGEVPPAATLRRLQANYPHVEFSWELVLGNVRLDSGTRHLTVPESSQQSISQLYAWIDYLPQLEQLHLGDTPFPEEALLALEQGRENLRIIWQMDVEGVPVSRDAQELDLSGRKVDLSRLEERIALMPQLRKVVLADCNVTTREMAELEQRHSQIRFVWTVNLGGIRLRTDARTFAPIKYNVNVTDKDLEDLQYCYDMVCIDIGHNRGVTHCRWAANMPGLKYLVIADTNIKDLSPLAGLQELTFLEVFMSPVRDYSPLLECPKLEDLNLGYTYGSADPVMNMKQLKRLWWPGALRVLTWDVRNKLKTNLPDTKMNFVAGSSTGEGWRSGAHYYAMRDMLGLGYMSG